MLTISPVLYRGELMFYMASLQDYSYHISQMVQQHAQSASLGEAQRGPRASSRRASRLWAARRSQGETGLLGAQPRVLERAASKAADLTAFHHARNLDRNSNPKPNPNPDPFTTQVSLTPSQFCRAAKHHQRGRRLQILGPLVRSKPAVYELDLEFPVPCVKEKTSPTATAVPQPIKVPPPARPHPPARTRPHPHARGSETPPLPPSSRTTPLPREIMPSLAPAASGLEQVGP